MRLLDRALLYLGVFAAVAALSKYHASSIGGYDLTTSPRLIWAGAYASILSLVAFGLGLPDLTRGLRHRIGAAVGATAVTALAFSAIQLVVGDALLPRFVVFTTALVMVPWFIAVSSIADVGRTSMEGRARVLVVGPEQAAEELRVELDGAPERPASIVGAISVDAAADVTTGARPLLDAVHTEAANVLVLDGEAQYDERIVDQAAVLHVQGIRVRPLSLFYEEWLGKLPVQDLGRTSLFFDIGEVHRDRYSRIKRVADLAAGVVGMIALGLAIPVVVVANAFANRGPLFYRQSRVGLHGREFTILKFRTMTAAGDGEPTTWTSNDDPRVTPVGSILRRTHLDELPQMWNILRGDLSLVGPRPEQPQYVAELVEKLPYYELRHSVRPGLTGWAQVKYGYAGDERDALEKLQYDFHYLRRQSLLFDLRIAMRTIRAVLGGPGAGR